MGLMSFFKRGDAAPAAKPVADSADAVQQLRLRARRRLIGAAVLVGLGVIGFPLVFETQPRPIPVDLPIEIPRKDAVAPLIVPAPVAVPHAASAEPPPAQPQTQVAEVRPETARPVVERVEKPVEARVTEKPVERPAERTAEKAPEKTPEKQPERRSTPSPEAARVQALLEGKPAERSEKKASEAAAGRFIVQVGAYADAKAAQDARMKVERLGLKTYTQAVETADGRRIRVRVGPFGSREEADKAAAKVRVGGLASAVLTL